MKKVLSLMIVVAAAAMVSCAGKQAKQAETVEVEATEVVETPACCEELRNGLRDSGRNSGSC